jgi:hypothetical protein
MFPTTKRTILRLVPQALLLLSLLIALPCIAQSQTASPCRGSQLSALREGDGARPGEKRVFYSFKNDSQAPCTLRGWPVYVLLDHSGYPIKPQNMAAEGVPDEPHAVTLAPGGKAFFSVDYTLCSSTSDASDRYKHCTSSAKARITAPGTKRKFIIREAIALEGLTFSGSEIVSTLQELKTKP